MIYITDIELVDEGGACGAVSDRFGLKGLAREDLEPLRRTSVLLLLSLRRLQENHF